MSSSSWIEKLASIRKSPQPRATSDARPRVALVGMGNELNGDDAAGVLVARRLVRRFPPGGDVLALEAGMAPESCTGALRRFAPDAVVFIDAGAFGGQPGDVALFDGEESQGFSASTHILPPALLSQFLKLELGCQVWMLAIQPVHVDFDRPMSPEVQAAVRRVTRALGKILLDGSGPSTR